MKRLKKIFFVLAVVVALGGVGASTASACVVTAITPNATANPTFGAPLVRAEGAAEKLATIAVNCTTAAAVIGLTAIGNDAGNAAPLATANSFITITLSGVNFAPTAVGGAAANNTSNFPAPTIASTVAMGVKPVVSVGGGSVTFAGMTPGAGAQIITITGLRANIAGSGLDQSPLTATVSFGGGLVGPTAVMVIANVARALSNSGTTGAFVWPGPFAAVTTTPIQFPSCVPPLLTPGGATPAATARTTDAGFSVAPGNSQLTARIRPTNDPGFAGAFYKPRLNPLVTGLTVDANTEDGGSPADTDNAAPTIGQNGGAGPDDIYGNLDDVLGGALQGSRFIIKLTGIPAGITIYAPRQFPAGANGFLNQAGTTVAALLVRVLAADTTDGSGGALGAITGRQLDKIDTVGGEATIVYEWVSTPSAATTDVTFFVTGAAPIATGTISGTVNMAPIGPPTVSPSRPQFTGGRSSKKVADIAACASYLLFPWIAFTADGAFDTGMAISNTSADPPGSAPKGIGTPPQSGDVTLFFWRSGGGTNPAPVTIAKALPAGQSATFVASSLKDAFTGYIIAVCDFAFGHGFAFINSPQPGTGGQFAQGYVALSLPNPRLGGSAGQVAVAVEGTGH